MTAGQVAERALQHVEALVDVEGAGLADVPRDGDHELGEDQPRAVDQIEVPVRDRVEARGEECLPRLGCGHASLASGPAVPGPPGTNQVISVSP